MTLTDGDALFPPYRFAYVEETLLRGAYPRPINAPFLRTLKLSTVISLTPEPLSRDTELGPATALVHIKVDKPKDDAIPLSFPKVFQILSLLIDPRAQPLYIHCLDGTVVTSLVIMCLRKLQGWLPSAYYSEAGRFLRDGLLSPEETEFMDKFTGDFELAASPLPKWLWGGSIQGWKRHPFFKLKFTFLPTPAIGPQGTTQTDTLIGGLDSLAISSSNEGLGLSSGASPTPPPTTQSNSFSVSSSTSQYPFSRQQPSTGPSASRPHSASTSISLATLKLQQEKEELRRMALLDDSVAGSPPIMHTTLTPSSATATTGKDGQASITHHLRGHHSVSGIDHGDLLRDRRLNSNSEQGHDGEQLGDREDVYEVDEEDDDAMTRLESRTLEALDLEVMTSNYTLGN